MLAKGICAALIAGLALSGQVAGGLQDRIRNAPLTVDERQAVEEAFRQKAFERLESVLAGAMPADAPKERVAARRALLGALEFSSGRIAESVQAYQSADSLSPLDERDRFTLAMGLVDLGDDKGARAQLTQLNTLHPERPLYLYWLGRIDYTLRRYDEAVERFKKVAAMDPKSPRGYDNLGLTYDMMGKTEEARAAFLKATEINRTLAKPSPWPADNLGYFQMRQLEFDEAEKNLREALKFDPKFALAHYHLARVLENKNQYDEAIEEYKSAAALDTRLAQPLYSLGLLYRRRGREAESAKALAEYRRRKALSPDSQ